MAARPRRRRAGRPSRPRRRGRVLLRPAREAPALMPVSEGKLRLGGMALRNGLLIHGPTHWAAAARDADGEIRVSSQRRPELAPGLVARLPGLRGPVKLAEAIAVLPLARRRLPAARMPFEDWRVVGAV